MTNSLRSRTGRVRAGLVRVPVFRSEARAAAHVLASMSVVGGILWMLGVAVAHERIAMATPQLVIGVAGVSVGWLVWRFGPSWPAGVFHLLLVAGTTGVLVSAWAAGEGTVPVALGTVLVGVALYAGLFFSPAAAVAHGLFGVVGMGLVLAAHGQPLAFELLWLAGVVGLVAGVSHWVTDTRAWGEFDPLTGAANRHGLTRVLSRAMSEADRSSSVLSLGLLDLDRFARTNDDQGRAAGDRVLMACAARWQELLPDGGTLARHGGDEFALVLEGHDLAAARDVVERLRVATPKGHAASAGVATWVPGDSSSMLISRAATAVHEAKRKGRGRTEVVGYQSDRAAEIRAGLGSGQFVVHYQPVVDLSDGRLVGLEALVRWQHPVRGLLGPDAFLATAEATGSIHALGRFVLDRACAQWQAWSRLDGSKSLTIAVNISTGQLRHPRLVDDVREALERHRVPTGGLVLEVTEGALVGDIEDAIAVLWELRGLGVGLAIDDFGTGHSSLGRLRNLPFDILKIDRSFVTGLALDRASRGVLVAIVAVAEAFGMRTVAEGVEDEDELDLVRHLGCDQAQGYLFTRPVPAGDLDELVAVGGVSRSLFTDATGADGEASATRAAFVAFAAEGGDAPSLGLRLRSLLQHLREATGLEAIYLTHIDWDRLQQHVLISENDGTLTISEGMTLAWQDTPCRAALLEGSDSYSRLQATLGSPAARTLGFRTHISVPITIADGHIYGTLCAASATIQPLRPSVTSLFRLIARLIASHLEPRLHAVGHPSIRPPGGEQPGAPARWDQEPRLDPHVT